MLSRRGRRAVFAWLAIGLLLVACGQVPDPPGTPVPESAWAAEWVETLACLETLGEAEALAYRDSPSDVRIAPRETLIALAAGRRVGGLYLVQWDLVLLAEEVWANPVLRGFLLRHEFVHAALLRLTGDPDSAHRSPGFVICVEVRP